MLFAAVALLGAEGRLYAGDLREIRTLLNAEVGGAWNINTNQMGIYVAPTDLPEGLDRGTYGVFVSDSDRTALEQATTWMEICQAPFFILGTNTDCVVVTYVPRQHPVSRAIIKALKLNESVNLSPAEAMILRNTEQTESAQPAAGELSAPP